MHHRWFSIIGTTLTMAIIWSGAMGRAQAPAIPTRVMVRVVSQDAKILSDHVGGARVIIRDARTGEILAQGIQKGGSGDTKRIMIEPRKRGASIYDTPGAAGFSTTLMLTRPTVVEVIAEGPLNYPQATQRASKTLLLVPGKDVLGDGIVLTLHGFIVTLETPASEANANVGQPLPIRATVRMM